MAALLLCFGVVALTAPAGARLRFSDVRGRVVDLPGPVRRVTIDDGRYLVALSLISRDPVALLAGWPQDVNRLGPDTYKDYLAKFPRLAAVPKVASSAADFNVESVIAAHPDVAIVSTESGPTDAQVRQLAAAKIPVVFIDFFVKPAVNLPRSLRILGVLTGRRPQAEAFLAFRRTHLRRIAARLRGLAETARPSVFVEAHAGMPGDCCNAPGRGNIGDYIRFVGGRNLASAVVSQSFGKINLEYVIAHQPSVYIATGGPHLAKSGGFVLGEGYSPAQARASLQHVVQRSGIAGLSAVKAGRAYGISHQLLNSPLDLVAIEAFARWVQPAKFKDVDPAGTLAEINRRFLAVPYSGTFWTALR